MSHFQTSFAVKNGTINPNLLFTNHRPTINTSVNTESTSPKQFLHSQSASPLDFTEKETERENDDALLQSFGTSPHDSSPAGTLYSISNDVETPYDLGAANGFTHLATTAPIAVKQPPGYRHSIAVPDGGLAMTFPLSHAPGDWLVDNAMFQTGSLRTPIAEKRYVTVAPFDRYTLPYMWFTIQID
jgi:hypothetical protein